jgi:hypothetical protein
VQRLVSPRYDVGTMKLRGEPRIYFVVDRTAPQFNYPNSRYASVPFTTTKAAERECLRMNQRANDQAQRPGHRD